MIATSVAINEDAIVDVCVRFIREISFSLNEQSSRQECFSGVALAFALEVHGIAATENDRHATDLARKKMKGAHAYDLTLTPEELDWWRDLGNRLENASARRTRLLDIVPVS